MASGDALWNLHQPQIPQGTEFNAPLEVMVDSNDDDSYHVDEETGAIEIPTPDGGVIVDFNPPGDENSEDFGANLAEKLGPEQLGSIAQSLIEAIEADDQSRAEWLQTLALGLELLGIKIEQPGSAVGSAGAPLTGMSKVRHPLLLEAVLRFQANARGELLPASGPAKVRNFGDETGVTDDLAEAYEKDLNYYLTVTASEYYPDTDRLLFYSGLAGSGFKKLYRCPLRRRPVSESVDAKDLIVSDAATDIRSSGRVTQKITMRPSVMKRMQVCGAYLDVPLTQPTPKPNAVDTKEAAIQGVRAWTQRPEDQPYTLYECYCELDLPGYEHEEKGEATGLPLPYRVVIEVDTQQVLAVHRNWDEDDPQCQPKRVFVKYPYIEGLGFYGIGLLHILGNSTQALTAAWREALDAGMFASFPGFLISKAASRQNTNEFRVAPGTGQTIDTGSADINKAIMPLPYKDVTPGLMQLIDKITASAEKVGSTAEIGVGEGNAEVPVGTTLALLEQATKIESAVHKRLHAAQSEEFQLLRDLFIEDPEALWRCNPGSAVAKLMGFDPNAQAEDDAQRQAQIAKFTAALANYNMVPVADPNTPSHMHRLMKAVALKQLQAQSPGLYDPKAVDTRILKMIGWSNPEELFAPPAPPPGPPPIDPIAQQAMALKAQEVQIKAAKAAADIQNSNADRESKHQLAVLDLAKEIAIHGQGAQDLAENVIQQQASEPPPVNPAQLVGPSPGLVPQLPSPMSAPPMPTAHGGFIDLGTYLASRNKRH